jgi:hypothetical protein
VAPNGPATQLVLGIDGRNLYAATGTGAWRLALGSGARQRGTGRAPEAF